MAREGIVAVEEEVVVSGGPVGKANDWGAIIGGALGAIAVSIILFTAGSGFGGYLAGRLRAKWVGLRTDEVLFRDTAHGMLAWALATVIVAALFAIGTGITGTTAAVTADAATAAEAAQEVSQEALEAAANFSIFTAISLLVGGFIGAVAGGLGGYHRDAV